jgi:hypothetical protein
MLFVDLAWGAFGFAAIAGLDYKSSYASLATDQGFIGRLQNGPTTVDLQRLRDFLPAYGVPFAPRDLAAQLAVIWPELRGHVLPLASDRIETCDLETMGEHVTEAYGLLWGSRCWGGDTVASKLLHFCNPTLFMMWDMDIQNEYGKHGGAGYLEFMFKMQTLAREVMDDFRHLAVPGRAEEYLSQRLGYSYTRPLAKFLDDYNWAIFAKKWPPVPPLWLLSLMCRQTTQH